MRILFKQEKYILGIRINLARMYIHGKKNRDNNEYAAKKSAHANRQN